VGVSTDAILFYGYVWEDEDSDPLGIGDKEWSEVVLEKRGEKNPWHDYPAEDERLPYEERRKKGDAWAADHRAEIDAWYAKKRAVVAEFGVDVCRHCSGDCPMLYISTKEHLASRGNPVRIESLVIEPGSNAKLDRFLQEFGVRPPASGLGWWLVSYWG
jgi:hypothetical protein